jgi:hypothetical protein
MKLRSVLTAVHGSCIHHLSSIAFNSALVFPCTIKSARRNGYLVRMRKHIKKKEMLIKIILY